MTLSGSRFARPAEYLPRALCLLAATNVVLVTLLDGYDWHLGPIHLKASNLFKPLLYLNGSVLLAILVRREHRQTIEQRGRVVTPEYALIAALLTLGIYGISFVINLHGPDWFHQVSTAGRNVFSFFRERQSDGFYRPLTFVSLWIDHHAFGRHVWGFHIQNLLLHFANGLLAARMALRLNFSVAWSRAAGLLLIALPAAFEAVIWPGARFDLMAVAFTLLALERALAGSVAVSAIAYAAAVLSKESGYCYPLLLGALFLFRRPLALQPGDREWRKLLAAAVVMTAILLAIRLAVYHGMGGYPGAQSGHAVNFEITHRTFTSIFTRTPASLYLVNNIPEMLWWMKAAVVLYAGTIAVWAFRMEGAGPQRVFAVMPFVAVLPAVNMIAWLNEAATQGRYVYLPGVWAVYAICAALAAIPAGKRLAFCLGSAMAIAAFYNTYAYIRMIGAAEAAAYSAAPVCQSSGCCKTLYLESLPRDLYGAFYYRYEVHAKLIRLLPDVFIPTPGEELDKKITSRSAIDPCSVTLRWSESGWVRD